MIWLVASTGLQAQDSRILYAREAIQQGDYTAAIDRLETLIAQDSLLMQAYPLLGSSYLAIRQPVLAEETAERGLHHFAGMPFLLWIKAEALMQQGQLKKAIEAYRDVGKHNGGAISDDKIKSRLGLAFQGLGGQYFRQKNYEQAEKYLLKSRGLMPDSLASYSNLGLLYMKQKKWSQALDVIDTGLEHFPDNEDLMRMKASVLYQSRDYGGVIAEYKKLYRQHPDDLDTALAYARLLLAGGEAKKANTIYDRLLKAHPDNRKIYESLVDFFDVRYDMQAKRAALRKMRRQFPGDPDILLRIADTYEKEEKWDQARAVYDTVRTLRGSSRSLKLSVAETYLAQDSLEAASAVFEKLLRNSPDDEDLLLRQGALLEKMGRWKAAGEVYQHLVKVSAGSEGYSGLGRSYLKRDEPDRALEAFSQALARDSRDPADYLQAARLNLSMGARQKAYDQGVEALKRALKAVQESQQTVKGSLEGNGSLKAMKGAESSVEALKQNDRLARESFGFVSDNFQQDKVEVLLGQLKETYPNSGRLLFLISGYYLDRDDTGRAIPMLKEAVRLSPAIAGAHKALARYYERSGRPVQAIQSYERALSANPDFAEAYQGLIHLYRKQGELDTLCDRWLARYRANKRNKVLKEHLIEALHKAGRFEEAEKLIDQ